MLFKGVNRKRLANSNVVNKIIAINYTVLSVMSQYPEPLVIVNESQEPVKSTNIGVLHRHQVSFPTCTCWIRRSPSLVVLYL